MDMTWFWTDFHKELVDKNMLKEVLKFYTFFLFFYTLCEAGINDINYGSVPLICLSRVCMHNTALTLAHRDCSHLY